MPVPLVALAAGMVAGVVVSVGGGYIMEKTIGDGDYSMRDASIDMGIGLVPGAAFAKPIAKIGFSTRKLRWFSRAEGDRVRDVGVFMAYDNRHNIKHLGLFGATTLAVGGAYDVLTGKPAGGGIDPSAGTLQDTLSGSTPPFKGRKGKTSRCRIRSRGGKRCLLRSGHSGRHRF